MKPNPYLIDDDNPEWTKEDFRTAIRAKDFYSPEQLVAIKQAQINLKEKLEKEAQEMKRISLKLDPKIIAHFKATGKNWQQRINDTLLKEIKP